MNIQIQETVRIFIKVLEEEMGARLSSAAKAAWNKAMTIAFVEMMGDIPTVPVSGKSALSASDIALVRASYGAVADNANIPPKVFLKYFKSLQFIY